LITRAYALIGRATAGAPQEAQLAIHSQVEWSLGTAGILNGQARDLKFTSDLTGPHGPGAIALGKTAPLITMAMTVPALLGGAPEAHIKLLRRLGVYWGLYYQGLDDLKDMLESTAVSGKTSGRDSSLGRPNVAHQIGVERSREYLRRLVRMTESCIAEIVAAHPASEFLVKFQSAMVRRLETLPE
jgi:geranylgeranyl pyrophosphate synthase